MIYKPEGILAETTGLMQRLGAKEQRGSKPRCHWLTHGDAGQVAARLNALVQPWAKIEATDRWMPEGFDHLEEPQLDKAPRLLDPAIGRSLAEWWLPHDRLTAKTPNFDIACTCTVDGKSGLMLVEAKAHNQELINEAKGRLLGRDPTGEREASNDHIGDAIEEARTGLEKATGLGCRISRDRCYQMSNRFAWSWKLAMSEIKIPVVLVYLGFLRANEMSDIGIPFAEHDDWETLVKKHSETLFPNAIWNRRWSVEGVPFIPLIRSVEVSLQRGLDY